MKKMVLKSGDPIVEKLMGKIEICEHLL